MRSSSVVIGKISPVTPTIAINVHLATLVVKPTSSHALMIAAIFVGVKTDRLMSKFVGGTLGILSLIF